jgi:hypothetical protein
MTTRTRTLGQKVRSLGGSLLAAWLVGSPLAQAQSASADRLAPIVARVLSYERTLAGRAGQAVDVIVLFDKANRTSAEEAKAFEAAFESLGGTTVQGLPLHAQMVAHGGTALERALAGGGDVVLICSGLEASLPAIAKDARGHHALTIGVRREHVQSVTSLAVIIESDKPKILANLSNASAEGVQLSAQLLRRSEVL